MTLYDILDAIADGVNPALGLIAVAQLLNMAYKRRWRCAGIYLATLCALATVIYGFMAFDRRIFDFPYSTHSAFAACFCALHAVYMPRLKFVWLGLLASYLRPDPVARLSLSRRCGRHIGAGHAFYRSNLNAGETIGARASR